MSIPIGSIGGSLHILADEQAFWLDSQGAWDLRDRANWPRSVLDDPRGTLLAIQAESLLETGLGTWVDGLIKVPWLAWDEVIKMGLEAPLPWCKWSPFLLRIDSSGSIGRSGFQYQYQYMLGTREVSLKRTGAIVQRDHHPGLFVLDPQAFSLVEAMDGFNALTPAQREQPEAWIRFGEVKGCAEGVGAQLDEYLSKNDVVVPSKIGLTVVEKADGSVQFLPRCEGVPREAFEQAFMRSREDQALFHFDGVEGRKIRVVLNPTQQEALSRMKRVPRLTGEQAEKVRRTPQLALEGVLDVIEVAYSRRVEGIGDWRPLPLPRAPSPVKVLEWEGLDLGSEWDPEAEAEALGMEYFKVPVTLKAKDPISGVEKSVKVQTQPEARALLHAMRSAETKGESNFLFKGESLPVDSALGDLLRRGNAEEGGSKLRKFLLIYTDEEVLKAFDEAELAGALEEPKEKIPLAFQAPRSLVRETPLKPHQEEAVAWLQRCAQLVPNRRGALLADEMGLGKTLEVLTFLAWCIEKGTFQGLNQGPGPYRPILVVAPLMLVENRTWQKDMNRFFSPGTFDLCLSLHGPKLQEFRRQRGRETDIGEPLLAIPKLQEHRVVITNYETITNYQHSFAQVDTRDGRSIWSILITDEAQEFKNPQARISHAIKAIHPDFHIACTGTPVENRLLDIWNLFDALQPALLGSARDFKKTFEPSREDQWAPPLDDLREKLLYQQPHAFLLRREKDILPDFPKKVELPVKCAMSVAEIDRHVRLIKALKQAASRPGIHLSFLHRMVDLYQHPLGHRDDFNELLPKELEDASPKLRQLLADLRGIQQQDEKALVFARHIKIQKMLAKVIGGRFGIPISIINGDRGTGQTSGERGGGREYRNWVLESFKAKPGFNVLVLSPFVAGVGLTITEANHVFHYGRWWNPAVESQATDRVYRIGQTREVQVHLPILFDPSGRIPATFDERLHELLIAKRDLARDFLAPQPTEEDLRNEMVTALSRDTQEEEDHKLTLDDLNSFNTPLLEAFVAASLEHDGHLVNLANTGQKIGISMIANRGTETWLVKVIQGNRQEEWEKGLDALAALEWDPKPNKKLLLGLIVNSSGLNGDRLGKGIEIGNIQSLLDSGGRSVGQVELEDRHAKRMFLIPASR